MVLVLVALTALPAVEVGSGPVARDGGIESITDVFPFDELETESATEAVVAGGGSSVSEPLADVARA